ncbi:MAG: flagellar hook protein FlgE, partial [Comamonas sp.]
AAMYSGAAPTGVAAASSTQTLDINGGLLSTGRNLDVAISGSGYFMTKDSTGMTNYTRTGIFDINVNGNLVDHLGRNVQGYQMTPGSDVLSALGTIKVPTGQIPAKASSVIEFAGNVSADWTTPLQAFDPAKPQSYNSSSVSVVYDSLGQQHTVTQYFVKTANANEVQVHYFNDGNAIADSNGNPVTQLLQFNPTGQLKDMTPSALSWVPSGDKSGAEPVSVTFDYTGMTQYAGDTTTTTNSADGYASGSMVNVQIGEDGGINVQYSNGMKQRVGMLALATFRSEGGLAAVDGTSWQATNASGVALVGTPNSGQFGSLASGQLEQSNVEVATELVDLMGAQRNYQANTKVISTQNDIMQSLMQVM